MTTAEILKERAIALATQGTETDQAVGELVETSGDRRVAVVMARRHLLEESPDDPTTVQALALLEEVLHRLPAE